MYFGKYSNELFDLESDPGEMSILSDSEANAVIKNRLIETLAELEIAVVDRVPMPTAQARGRSASFEAFTLRLARVPLRTECSNAASGN